MQHLNKIQEHYTQNRMNAGNLAICFGYVLARSPSYTNKYIISYRPANSRYRPTLLGSNSGGSIADAGWQVRVVETILNNTFQIFDDD